MTAISSLAYKDLRGYLDAADSLGELRKVDGADWDLEIGAITEVAARAANPKVVLFDHIKDYPKGFRVVTNPVCSAPTTALAFGLDPKLAGLDLIRAWKQKLGGQTPINGWLAFVLYIVFSPAFVAYMQSGLNSVWKAQANGGEQAV